jgi:hypothetical protein
MLMLRNVTKCEEMLQNVKNCYSSTFVLLLRNVTKCEEMLLLQMTRNSNMKTSRVLNNMKAGRVLDNTFSARFQFFQAIHFSSGSNFLTACLPSGLE